MRVLLLSWEYPPRVIGGLARHVEGLARGLAEAGHEVHVVTAQSGNQPASIPAVAAPGIAATATAPTTAANPTPAAQERGVHVHRVPQAFPKPLDFVASVMQLNFALIEAAEKLWDREPFDLIHAHDWLVAYAARVLKHAHRRPLVATIHATEYGRNRGLHTDLQRHISDTEWWLCYEAWRVIVCSQHMRQEIQWVFQAPPDKIDVIPNGVDVAAFKNPLRPDTPEWREFRRHYAAEEEKIIYFVGRLVDEKGAATLIEAMPKIVAYYPKVRAVISGQGPQFDYLKNRAYQLYMEDKVTFTGFVTDEARNKLFAVADVAVFPSTYEPFGIVALEGMANRVPVVVADTGGLSEIVEHGANGLKAYPGNPDSLANNVLTLLHDPELAAELRDRALSDLAGRFDWGRIALTTIRTYERILREFASSPWGRDARARRGAGSSARLSDPGAGNGARASVAVDSPAANVAAGVAYDATTDNADKAAADVAAEEAALLEGISRFFRRVAASPSPEELSRYEEPGLSLDAKEELARK